MSRVAKLADLDYQRFGQESIPGRLIVEQWDECLYLITVPADFAVALTREQAAKLAEALTQFAQSKE